LKPRGLQVVNDCFKNESNAVVGVFLQRLYTIDYTEDKEKGIVTDINWHRVKERERPKGEYFLRYTNDAVTETDIWDVYNMTRDVEAVQMFENLLEDTPYPPPEGSIYRTTHMARDIGISNCKLYQEKVAGKQH
jgi:hypothetical protein